VQASFGDRCRRALVALCIGIIAFVSTAGALSADYSVYPNGTVYHAVVEVEGRDAYEFTDLGLLGEAIPEQVWNISVRNASCEACPYSQTRPYGIAFERGNYTIEYDGQIRDNHLHATFDVPYRVRIFLPEGLDVRNPFLGAISREANVTEEEGGSLMITWEETKLAECRFYDPTRELMLATFGTLWITVAIVLLVPYLLWWMQGRRRR
jgi:hypothetical protein